MGKLNGNLSVQIAEQAKKSNIRIIHLIKVTHALKRRNAHTKNGWSEKKFLQFFDIRFDKDVMTLCPYSYQGFRLFINSIVFYWHINCILILTTNGMFLFFDSLDFKKGKVLYEIVDDFEFKMNDATTCEKFRKKKKFVLSDSWAFNSISS